MAKVTPYLNEELEALGFQRIRSVVEVALSDGTVLKREASTSRGTPDRPMSKDELAGKFADCAEGMLTPSGQSHVLELIYNLDGLDDVRSLTSVLKG